MDSTADHLHDEIEGLRSKLRSAMAENEALRIKISATEEAYMTLMQKHIEVLRKDSTVSIPIEGTIGHDL